MYAMFPSFALARSRAGISIRDAAGRIGVSYTYLSQMEDFLVVPSPDTKTQRREFLTYTTKCFMELRSKPHRRPAGTIEPAVNEKPHENQLSLEADYTFFMLQKTWWNHLLLPLDNSQRQPGPLFNVLLEYFDESEDTGNILLYRPQLNSEEPFLFDVIANFCERYYNPESFRRRRPRNWSPTPPFVSKVGEHGVVFRTDLPDSITQIFYAHPTGNYFALFLLYSLLRGVQISTDGLNCAIVNPPQYVVARLESRRNDNPDSRMFSWFEKENGHSKSTRRVRFTLTPPAYRIANRSPDEADMSANRYIPTPENMVVHVCLKDLFSADSPWCWCVAPAGRTEP